jgi:hypothetical protein
MQTVNVTQVATLLYGSKGSNSVPVQIINFDEVNTLWIGNVSNLSTVSQSIPLNPGTSVTFDGSVTIYGITEPGITVQAGIVANGLGYAPGTIKVARGTIDVSSGTIDANVTNASLPVTGTVDASITNASLSVTGNVDINSGTIDVIGSGGYFPPGNYAFLINDTSVHTLTTTNGNSVPYITAIVSMMEYQSYSLSVQCWCPAQGSTGAPFTMPVTLLWYADSNGSYLLEKETVWMWVINNSADISEFALRGGGPAKGAYAAIQFNNLSSSETINVAGIFFSGNGRAISKTRFTQPSPRGSLTTGISMFPIQNIAGTELTGYPDGSDGIICNESDNGNTASNNIYWLPLPLYSGKLYCRYATSEALANDFVLASAAPLFYGEIAAGTNTQGVVWNPGNTAGQDYVTEIIVGNEPLYFVVKTNSTAPIITVEIHGEIS